MKNTKHTENLDNSTPQEITSQSKRKILTSIGVSSGILGASALSQQWTKPIVNSIILPAHAQSTPMTTMAMGTTDMMGMPRMTTTMDARSNDYYDANYRMLPNLLPELWCPAPVATIGDVSNGFRRGEGT